MQKKLVLAAAVAGVLAAPTAFAQSTFYGHLDVGVQRVDPGEGYNGSDLFLNDQQGSGGSFVGWRATDDLGGGMKGLAVVEVGFFTDTGNFDNNVAIPAVPAGGSAATTSSLQFAQRQVYVGLEAGFGTVTAGRQYREIFLVGSGGAYNYTAAGIGVFFQNPNTGVRQSNFIKYASPSMGGLNIVAGYGLGEGTTAATEDNRYTELGVKYGAGPLRVGAVLGQDKAAGVDLDLMLVGGQFSFGPTTVYAIFSTADNSGTIDEQTISLGAKQNLGSGDVVVQVAQRSVDTATNADSTLIGVGYYHRLSKATTAYVSYGMLKNDDGAQGNAPRQAVATTAAGEDPSTLSFGLRRTF